MTKEEFLALKEQGLTNKNIGVLFNLTERQVSIRVSAWGLNYSNKKYVNSKFFSQDTKEVYYWAGFLAADGWIESNRHRIGLALQNQDIQHLYKFKKAVSSNHDICPFMNNSSNRIRFNSKEMVEDLRRYFNITEAKTFTYTMPYFEDDYKLLEFLRGYIEGDGHLELTKSRKVALHLCSANRNFLEEFKSICEVLVDRPIEQQINLQINKKGQVYSIRFNINDSNTLINLFYKNSTNKTRLNRKFEIASLILDKGIVQ